MNVHMITDRFSMGGGAEHIFQVVKGIREIDFRIFAYPASSGHPAESERVMSKFKALNNVLLDDEGYVPGSVLQNKPDIIHFHHLLPLFHFYKNPFRQHKVPVIFTAHGLHIHKYEFSNQQWLQKASSRIKYILRFILEKYLLKQVDRIIAVSREDELFIQSEYQLNNVTYLTNGIAIDCLGISDSVSRTELRKSLNLPVDCFLFMTVARFNFQKAYDFLINTIGPIGGFLKENKVRFILVGGGAEFDRIQKMVVDLGLSSFVSFLGERTDSLKLIKAGDIFLLPSRWEGLPIVLLECGLLQVPVIASDTYGNREIIGQDNGILFKNLDGPELIKVIKKAVNREYDWDPLIKNLKREVQQNYSIEKMLAGLRAIYNSF